VLKSRRVTGILVSHQEGTIVASMFPEALAVHVLVATVVGARAGHPASKYVGTWHTPPYRCPTSMVSDCPLLGNGDMGVGLGGISSNEGILNQTFYLGKMDFWTQVRSRTLPFCVWFLGFVWFTRPIRMPLCHRVPSLLTPVPRYHLERPLPCVRCLLR
jgi:hypothetical protein